MCNNIFSKDSQAKSSGIKFCQPKSKSWQEDVIKSTSDVIPKFLSLIYPYNELIKTRKNDKPR